MDRLPVLQVLIVSVHAFLVGVPGMAETQMDRLPTHSPQGAVHRCFANLGLFRPDVVVPVDRHDRNPS